MTTRRLLIGLPIIVLLFLLQSYFWVPTYEEQTRGNPERLEEYVTASIGDAQVLNPALSADSASSDINGLVFEGLLDYDVIECRVPSGIEFAMARDGHVFRPFLQSIDLPQCFLHLTALPNNAYQGLHRLL